VSRDRAILAVDLASVKQAAIVLDHDSVVLGRWVFTGSAWCISEILAWAGPIAAKAGFGGWCWHVSRPGTGGNRLACDFLLVATVG
jgi:hypothetical protein